MDFYVLFRLIYLQKINGFVYVMYFDTASDCNFGDVDDYGQKSEL